MSRKYNPDRYKTPNFKPEPGITFEEWMEKIALKKRKEKDHGEDGRSPEERS